jgi:hypothetical protein
MELLVSGLGMLACMAAMMAIMPVFARVARLARGGRADATARRNRQAHPDAALPR